MQFFYSMQKYKVFLNERRILFRPSRKITIYKTSKQEPYFSDNRPFNQWFREFLLSDKTETVIEHACISEVLNNFRSHFHNMDAAGGVVRKDGKILFIFRNGKWDLPKGKIDEGETTETAALREVEEECGISGHNIRKSLPSSFHIYQSPYADSLGQWIFKETCWFEMEYNGNENGKPQTEEDITEVRWFAPSELNQVMANTYENLKQIIEIYRV